MSPDRPRVHQRVWFALGGRVPMQYRDWVLADATSRTWLLHFLLRSTLRMAPLVLIMLLVLTLLGAPLGLALASVALGLIVAVYYSVSYAVERTEQRVASYGFPLGTAAKLRRQRAETRNPGQRERYERTWRHTDEQ